MASERPDDGTEDCDERCTGTESCECADCQVGGGGYDCDADCYVCGGEGWVECDDPIQCTYEHDDWGYCRCSSCGGSGSGKDMRTW